MNSRRGKRARPATVSARRPRPASGRNASRRRVKLSGLLFLSNDGKSKFYPDGGRERRSTAPRGVGRPKRRVSRLLRRTRSREERPMPAPVSSARYYNSTFYANENTFNMEKPGDDDSNYGSEAPPNLQMAMMRTYITCFAIGLLLVLLVTAIVVPVVIVASTSTRPTVTGYMIIRTGFTSVLDDTSSAQYTTLKTDFESAMNQIFRNSATYVDDFKESTVTDFAASETTTTTQVDFSVVFNSDVGITRLLRNSVFDFITEETLRAGSPFAPLDVIPSTLNITDSCGVYCENNGVLSVISCTCTCALGFTGATCTITL
ncbi:uncharacterized protein [Asterias amurensis]|uniref:uncharacterized protein n=1 Tax=Asterias amurensis TaxID=7602 RepID=UPI003AB40DD0